jgi:Holliday junction resolvase RusA-like endonuclease
MNDTLFFMIPGEPQGKGRPRYTRSGHTYTPDSTRAYEALVRACYAEQVNSEPFAKGVPLVVTIECRFGVPLSDSVKKRQAKLCDLMMPTKRVDADNVAKIICDALNGIAYYDDAQVTTLHVVKRYGVEPCVKVWISKEDT